MGFYDGAKIITNGLVLSLDAADRNSYPGSGTTWRDMSGNNTNGSLTNGPTFNSGNGGSIAFDGSNDYVALGTGTTINVFPSDFTVSVWAKRQQTGLYATTIIGDWYTNSVATTDQWQIQYGNNNGGTVTTLYVYIEPGWVFENISTGIAIDNWVNCVVTRIGSTMTLYANGKSLGTATNSRTWGTSAGNMNIGIDGNNSSEPFLGNIANILIYKGNGLTATEVLQNYQAQKSRFGL